MTTTESGTWTPREPIVTEPDQLNPQSSRRGRILKL
jgi:hypothetical protein